VSTQLLNLFKVVEMIYSSVVFVAPAAPRKLLIPSLTSKGIALYHPKQISPKSSFLTMLLF
jgi:hypothetical protein